MADSPAETTPAPSPAATRRAAGLWFAALFLAGWLVAGMIFTWPLFRFIELDWGTTSVIILFGWGPWGAISAAIILLARVVPVDAAVWKRALPFHVIACTALAFAANALSGLLIERRMPRPFVIRGDESDWSRPAVWTGEAGEFFEIRELGTEPTAETHSHPDPAQRGERPSRWDPDRTMPRSSFRLATAGGGGRFRGGGFFRPAPDAEELATMTLTRSLQSGAIVPVYFLLLAITQAIRNHRRAADQQRVAEQTIGQLNQARLQALQRQLQPHFLFNTLNSATGYLYDQPRIAEEMLCSLSELLRRSLALADRTEITLGEEVELMNLYLDIQRHRFGDRLSIEQEIDPALTRSLVPPLILQPTVENAIVHGLARTGSPKRIEIRALQVNDRLRLTVIDHNVSPPASGTTAPTRDGIGVENTRQRLATLYGNAGELHAAPLPNGGYLTEMNLPLRTVSAEPCES